MHRNNRENRGQAVTLEAVIAGLVVLSAFLFALQSTVVTPTTSSAVDPSTRADLRTQAEDILTLVESGRQRRIGKKSMTLSQHVRSWNEERGTFGRAKNDDVGYGSGPPPGAFGKLLNETFTQRDRSYNLAVFYQRENRSGERGRLIMVHQGTPGEGAVVASRTVILKDNETLHKPSESVHQSYGPGAELWQYDTNATNNDAGYYPIPNAVDGSVYNIVEVRLIVW